MWVSCAQGRAASSREGPAAQYSELRSHGSHQPRGATERVHVAGVSPGGLSVSDTQWISETVQRSWGRRVPGVFEASVVGVEGREGGRGGPEGREVTSWCVLLCLSSHLTVAPFEQGLRRPWRFL